MSSKKAVVTVRERGKMKRSGRGGKNRCIDVIVYIYYVKKRSLDASIINNYRPKLNLPFISKSIAKVVL